IGKYANPDGPEINLTDNNTFAGSTEKAYEKLSISVVSVAVYEKDENPDDDFPISEGTGIIISSDGYMVTNSHVVNDDSKSNVYITTKNGDEFSAVVVGCDVRTDIAVLKANNAENMPPAVFADSEKLKVGQDVVAIGSPGGSSYSNSLTRGIVSALDRNLDGSAVTYIQTDAAINPGNSGGPLANLNGQVVGINTIKIVNTQYEGMGFAIPSVTIKNIADRIIKNGYVADRPQLGIISKEISVTTAKANNTVAGIYVQQIQDKSPLKNTKLKEGDIITKIDNVEVTSFYKLFKVLDSHDIGDKVKVSVCRISKNDSSKKENFELQVTLIGD
ncbi:MAG: trypsin-like peptidase domain-containing protein, partial [Clostridia bacterium]|nr:trypsin-like peptidase domain-containing protein [Clostridia bacterium]